MPYSIPVDMIYDVLFFPYQKNYYCAIPKKHTETYCNPVILATRDVKMYNLPWREDISNI